eukprot:CAMPEP_0177408280 /NCGR_PEP_ID=MMETSP0368-20130122/63586_1 /TAXON_ID=447022 ORGANISM="Scrippsiella hangoei-like, Strain SHHI-4" /NCGR_SAMPLE_ID=MMETSP0368 /ASSEMBLY_ACC=CAM_ASM_000363 /LENGTH=143 /DNA_ID=CAMNT_0018876891 /DNA_START=8 /DNA_END=436 /DNA_ORIENTATION=-
MRGKHLKGAAAFKVGEVVEGTVLVVRQYEAFVDIGALTPAFLSIRNLGHCKFWLGQSIKVKITELHGRQIKLKLEEAKRWSDSTALPTKSLQLRMPSICLEGANVADDGGGGRGRHPQGGREEVGPTEGNVADEKPTEAAHPL